MPKRKEEKKVSLIDMPVKAVVPAEASKLAQIGLEILSPDYKPYNMSAGLKQRRQKRDGFNRPKR
ncbi:MAG: hypothetical protein JWM56_507 [Candidatus Peribacteria bacterium]|nr:hypothetical protein [Candidatus Peribacteria bacterium]